MIVQLGDELVTADNAANLSQKLQQLASGAIYTDENHNWTTLHDYKIQALKELHEQAEGNTLLVCFWFKHERQRIQEAIPEARYLDTAQDFKDWNAGNIPIALIHPASAGHGLNLQQGGHIMVWFTTPWSLELYEQANARLYRQGQTEPVSIVHIDAAGTIDEKIHASIRGKSMGQEALMNAVKAELGASQ